MVEKKRILIIDDSPSNINILNEILSPDYLISIATNGEKAFALLEHTIPDLILLDIMMPGMDGYEVCSQLKKMPQIANVPIIFVTAKVAIEDEAHGFNVGAVDYITKPVSPPIVRARVKTHLLIKAQQDKLRGSVSLLQHKAEILQHKAELGMLAAGLAHDINNILFAAMMVEGAPSLLPDDFEEKALVEKYIEDVVDALVMGQDICKGFTSYLNDIGEAPKVQPLAPLLAPIDMFSKTYRVKLYSDIPPTLPYIRCKGAQIKRVIVNLFINACQAVDRQKEKKITLRAWSNKDQLFFSIQDNGPGIPKDILPLIFNEHYTTRKDGNGLGLSMAKKIMEAHDGTLECFSDPGDGTLFICSLPALKDSLNEDNMDV